MKNELEIKNTPDARYQVPDAKGRFALKHLKLITAIGLVVIIASLWLIPGPSRVGATVHITPNQEQVQQGYEWEAKIEVESNIEVNALDISIQYPGDDIQVSNTSLTDSTFATTIFEPMVETQKNEVYFVQATLEPFSGQNGLVGTITFKAKHPAKPRIMVNPDSKIIAHDGQGTNVFQPKLTRSVGEWLVDLLYGKR